MLYQLSYPAICSDVRRSAGFLTRGPAASTPEQRTAHGKPRDASAGITLHDNIPLHPRLAAEPLVGPVEERGLGLVDGREIPAHHRDPARITGRKTATRRVHPDAVLVADLEQGLPDLRQHRAGPDDGHPGHVQTSKLLPQPHFRFTFGFSMWNPAPISSSL